MQTCYDLAPDDCRRVPEPGPARPYDEARASVGMAGVWLVGIIGVVGVVFLAYAAFASPTDPMPIAPPADCAAEVRDGEAFAVRFVEASDRRARTERMRTAFDPTPTPIVRPPTLDYTGPR